MATEWRNRLYFGDNLAIMREHIAAESVDLIYLDPPFNSKSDYNVLFKTASGEDNAAQATAFKDTWEWDKVAAEAFHEIMTSPQIPSNVQNLMQALKIFLTGDTGKKGNSMMAYLTMMALRLVELRRVLKPTGSIYLHCDPTASHYIKLLLDAVFGFDRHQAEFVWKRSSAHNDAKQGRKGPGRIHDTIFFYTKSPKDFQWNSIYTDYDPEYLKSTYNNVDPDGRRWKSSDLTGPGGAARGNPKYEFLGVTRYWRYSQDNMDKLFAEGRIHQSKPGTVPRMKHYLNEMPGVTMQDIWDDIPPISAQAQERLGYPTQKPEALLERILRASSNEGDVVLDPFCGCGTTVAVAERLNRKWIGIDITYLAVDLMERRLLDQFTPGNDVHRLADIPVQKRRKALKTYFSKGEDELLIGLKTGLKPFEVLGVPQTSADARYLFENDPYQFEWWAVAMLGAQGKERKKGADGGIDGIINFQDKPGDYHRAVVSVKGGKLNASMLRDLKGVMQREGAVIGILVTNEEPTGPMRQEAATAGRWNSEFHPDRSFPCLQIVTAEEILEGKDADIPRWGLNTFKKASRVKETAEQMSLLDE